MPPKVKRHTKKIEEKKTYPTLKKLNLEIGAEVRFRLNENTNWTKGKIKGDNPDKSLVIWDGDRIRCIMPENVQLKVKGPRGGTAWENIK